MNNNRNIVLLKEEGEAGRAEKSLGVLFTKGENVQRAPETLRIYLRERHWNLDGNFSRRNELRLGSNKKGKVDVGRSRRRRSPSSE